jgi:hypothetical protein
VQPHTASDLEHLCAVESRERNDAIEGLLVRAVEASRIDEAFIDGVEPWLRESR